MEPEALLLSETAEHVAAKKAAIEACNAKLDELRERAMLAALQQDALTASMEAWSMLMADGSRMTPDLEWFHNNFAPDEDRTDDFERAEHLRLLKDVYGEEHVMTDDQYAEHCAERRLRWQARTRERAWREVPDLRRKWLELNRVYGPGSDFGAF